MSKTNGLVAGVISGVTLLVLYKSLSEKQRAQIAAESREFSHVVNQKVVDAVVGIGDQIKNFASQPQVDRKLDSLKQAKSMVQQKLEKVRDTLVNDDIELDSQDVYLTDDDFNEKK